MPAVKYVVPKHYSVPTNANQQAVSLGLSRRRKATPTSKDSVALTSDLILKNKTKLWS